MQESTRESSFFLLYGRDPRLPTDAALCTPLSKTYLDIDDYKSDLTLGLTEAWKMARGHVQKAQKHQKGCYDRHAKDPTCRVGDRVFVLMPAAKAGKAHKFARPFHGLYRVLEVTNCDARVVPVDKPQDSPVFVALSRIRHYPREKLGHGPRNGHPLQWMYLCLWKNRLQQSIPLGRRSQVPVTGLSVLDHEVQGRPESRAGTCNVLML